jgi:hypothetical protein
LQERLLQKAKDSVTVKKLCATQSVVIAERFLYGIVTIKNAMCTEGNFYVPNVIKIIMGIATDAEKCTDIKT